MFVGYADGHAGDVYRFLNVQTKRRIIMSRDARWLNLLWKHNKRKHNHPRTPQVQLFLNEEENLNLEGNELDENRIEGDQKNTHEQRRLGLDNGMIGAWEEILGRMGVRPKKCSLPEMNPWKEQI